MAAPTTLDLLWGTPQRPRRGPKPSLSLERIVTEAIALADAEGLANLSMQHLAERLGCAKMALYRYVPARPSWSRSCSTPGSVTRRRRRPDERTRVGRARRSRPRPARSRGEPSCGCGRRRSSAGTAPHPWAIEASAGPRPTGPHELAWMETALAALAGTGLTGPERLDAVVLLNGHVRSLVQVTPGRTTSKPRSPARSARSCPPTRTVTRRSWRPSRARRSPAGRDNALISASAASSTASRPSSPPARRDHCRPARSPWSASKVRLPYYRRRLGLLGYAWAAAGMK